MFKSIVLTSEGRTFFDTLKELGKKKVYVGFLAKDGKAYEDGLTVAQVAAWNEFGTSDMPSRPFMRQTLSENQDKIKQLFDDAGKAVVKGAKADEVYNKIGVVAKAMMQDQIVNGKYKPNAPSTIRKKGSDRPLIDTGQMRQSVNYEIR